MTKYRVPLDELNHELNAYRTELESWARGKSESADSVKEHHLKSLRDLKGTWQHFLIVCIVNLKNVLNTSLLAVQLCPCILTPCVCVPGKISTLEKTKAAREWEAAQLHVSKLHIGKLSVTNLIWDC
jgi:hypothetical protein